MLGRRKCLAASRDPAVHLSSSNMSSHELKFIRKVLLWREMSKPPAKRRGTVANGRTAYRPSS